MNLYFFTEARFCDIKGEIWAPEAFSMTLWERYLTTFEHIYVVARIVKTDTPRMNSMLKIKSPKISFCALHYYVGLLGFIQNRSKITAKIQTIIHLGDAYLCRVPGAIGSIAANCLYKQNIPYSLEVVGDPAESLSYASNPHPLAPLLRLLSTKKLRKICKHASALLYVTQYRLQKLYPGQESAFTTYASNVVIKDDYLLAHPPTIDPEISRRHIRFLAVGTLAQLYKAPDLVLKALAQLYHNNGVSFELTWYGDGRYRKTMIQLAQTLGIAAFVHFEGQVPTQKIRETLTKTDIFLHVSRAEGLPRALIEAMAAGLPCIGTRIAGIPELLEPIALIPANNIKALVNKIDEFIRNPHLMQQQATVNLKTATEYHENILTQRRLDFYNQILNTSKI